MKIVTFSQARQRFESDNIRRAVFPLAKTIPLSVVPTTQAALEKKLEPGLELVGMVPYQGMIGEGETARKFGMVKLLVRDGETYHFAGAASASSRGQVRSLKSGTPGTRLGDSLGKEIFRLEDELVTRSADGIIPMNVLPGGQQAQPFSFVDVGGAGPARHLVAKFSWNGMKAGLEEEIRIASKFRSPGLLAPIFAGTVGFEDEQTIREYIRGHFARKGYDVNELDNLDLSGAMVMPYRSMTFKTLVDLYTFLNRKHPSDGWADELTAVTLWGLKSLAEVNREGYIHGDINPDNMLAELIPRQDGYLPAIEVMDFGVAKGGQEIHAMSDLSGNIPGVEGEKFWMVLWAAESNTYEAVRTDNDPLEDPHLGGRLLLSNAAYLLRPSIDSVTPEITPQTRLKVPRMLSEDEGIEWDDKGRLVFSGKVIGDVTRSLAVFDRSGPLTWQEVFAAKAYGVNMSVDGRGNIQVNTTSVKSYLPTVKEIHQRGSIDALIRLDERRLAEERLLERMNEHCGHPFSLEFGTFDLVRSLTGPRVRRSYFHELNLRSDDTGRVFWEGDNISVNPNYSTELKEGDNVFKLRPDGNENPTQQVAKNLRAILRAVFEGYEQGRIPILIEYAREREGLEPFFRDGRIDYARRRGANVPVWKDGKLKYVAENGHSLQGKVVVDGRITLEESKRLQYARVVQHHSSPGVLSFLGLETDDVERYMPWYMASLLAGRAHDSVLAERYLASWRMEEEFVGALKQVARTAEYAIAEYLGVADRLLTESASWRTFYHTLQHAALVLERPYDKDFVTSALEREGEDLAVIQEANEGVFANEIFDLLGEMTKIRMQRTITYEEIDARLAALEA